MSSHIQKYVRLIVLKNHVASGYCAGLFDSAYEIKRNGDVSGHDFDELDRLLNWFEKNLAILVRFNRTKSKGHYLRNTKGLSWFKPNANVHISNFRQIANILSEYGYMHKQIATARPGYIVYEDDFQIVAEPFADTQTQ